MYEPGFMALGHALYQPFAHYLEINAWSERMILLRSIKGDPVWLQKDLLDASFFSRATRP